MRRVIVIAAAGLSLAGCGSLVVGRLQIDATPRADSAGIDAAGRRCPYLPRTGLHDALLGQHPAARGERFHRHLHHGQVPAGHRPGTCRSVAMDRPGSIPIRSSPNFSASARRRSRPARKCTGRETQGAQGCRGPSRRGNRRSPTRRQRLRRLRRPHRLRRRPPADCLQCTTTAPQQRCRLCARSNMPTLCSRAAFTDITAAAPKGTFE